jgi:hypothetical protein
MAGHFLSVLLASTTILAISSAKPSPLRAELLTIPAPGLSPEDTRAAIARGLQVTALSGRDVTHRSQSQLDVNLQDATLVKM